jgi:putative ABC transport system permease protein
MSVFRGRDFTAADVDGAPKVAIINEAMAQQLWPGEDPIGKRLAVDDPRDPAVWATVVGVARDARQSDWTEPPRPEVYFPYLQRREYLDGTGNHVAYLSIVVRGAGDPAALASPLRAVVRGLDENVAVSQVATMEDVVAHANGPPRFFLAVLAAFAGVALVLAAVGIYGVMSYTVSRRTHEIGVRIALGARRRDVFRLVVGQGLGLALAGGLVGLAGALALTRLMRSMLYGVGATDVVTFAAVGIVLGVVAVGASALPARRALRIDPMAVLRGD